MPVRDSALGREPAYRTLIEIIPDQPGTMGFDHWLSHDNFFEMDPVFSLNGGPPKQFFGESSEIIVDEAIKYIENNRKEDKPFLLVIWYGSPHEPIQWD